MFTEPCFESKSCCRKNSSYFETLRITKPVGDLESQQAQAVPFLQWTMPTGGNDLEPVHCSRRIPITNRTEGQSQVQAQGERFHLFHADTIREGVPCSTGPWHRSGQSLKWKSTRRVSSLTPTPAISRNKLFWQVLLVAWRGFACNPDLLEEIPSWRELNLTQALALVRNANRRRKNCQSPKDE